MDEHAPDLSHPNLDYQTQRLRELMREMMSCCQDRVALESKKFDLPPAELKCLMCFDQERYLTVKGLAARLEVAKSRVTKILDGLEAKGLIERTEDPKDARVKLVCATPAGKRRAEAISEFLERAHRQILLNFEPERRQSLLAALEDLRLSMEAVEKSLD
jgi:DNA-binding MarR family transcriptional regulator